MTGEHHLGKWATNAPKNYPRLYSGSRRGAYVHRAVWEWVSGKKLPKDWHVHHMDGDKLNFAPGNLLALPAILHEGPQPLRCPYTGRFLSLEQYRQRIGVEPCRS